MGSLSSIENLQL